MPCCNSPTEQSPTGPALSPDLLVVSVGGYKERLSLIHSFQDSINQHPVQIGRLYVAESLQYLGLANLRISSGKFTATATFRIASGKHSPSLARANWTNLLLELWSSDSNV